MSKKGSNQFVDDIRWAALQAKRGHKGISVSHLLEFDLPAREQTTRSQPRRRRSNKNQSKSLSLNNQSFINVNYRFIVSHKGSYESQKADPNLPIDPSCILRVIAKNINACPICLESDDAIAIRMTSCGHCFCYPCLLSYLHFDAVSDSNSLRPCPLCAQIIRPLDIMPVLFDKSMAEEEKLETPVAGQEAVMKLMVRHLDSILALPASTPACFFKDQIPWCCNESGDICQQVYPYARIMKGNVDYIVSLYESEIISISERCETNFQLYGVPKDQYSIQAIEDIRRSIEELKGSLGKSKKCNFSNSEEKISTEEQPSGSDITASFETISLTEDRPFLFYETNFVSTTKYLLSSLDIKILRAMFGSYSNFPTTLVLPIENITYEEILTEDNRNKYKYISNFPYGTQLAFLEVDWVAGRKDSSKFTVPEPVFASFAKEIHTRSKANKRRVHIEEHNRQVAQRNLERSTREFYEKENWSYSNPHIDYEERHRQSNGKARSNLQMEQLIPVTDENVDEKDYDTTVWGTKIKKAAVVESEDEDNNDGLTTQEILRRVEEHKKESNKKAKGKKGKQKLVLFRT